MKKRISIMAGLLAMALVGSAQAATMFAVQNSGGVDQATISDAGDLVANGGLSVGGKYAGGLSNVPAGPGNVTITGPAGVFHVASQGNAGAAPAFLAQHAAYPITAGGTDYGPGLAPNFSFYRLNRNDASHPSAPLAYSLPVAGNKLGYFNFGSINTAVDPNLGTSRKSVASFGTSAESTWTSITDTPTYFYWQNSTVGGTQTEKMRLSSAGNLGIGTTAPTSKLQVVGLPTFADNAAALTGGLTAGAFYRTSTGVLMVVF